MKKSKKSINLYIIIISISVIVIGIIIWGILTKWKFFGSKSFKPKPKPNSIQTKFVGPVIKKSQKYYTGIKKLYSDGSFLVDNNNSFILYTAKCGIYSAFLPATLQPINSYIIQRYEQYSPNIKQDILKFGVIELEGISGDSGGFTMSCKSVDVKIINCTLPDTIQPKLKLTCKNVTGNNLTLNGGITPLSLELKLDIQLILKNFQVKWDLLGNKIIPQHEDPTIICSLNVDVTFDLTINTMVVDVSKISQQTINITEVDTKIDMESTIGKFTTISDTIKNLICNLPVIVDVMSVPCGTERAAACTAFTACHVGCNFYCAIPVGDGCKTCSQKCDSVGLMDACGICDNFPNNNDKYLPADCKELSTKWMTNCLSGLCFSVSENIIDSASSAFEKDKKSDIKQKIESTFQKYNQLINKGIESDIKKLHNISN